MDAGTDAPVKVSKSAPTIKLPTSQQRQLIVGRTGSGKTRAACWNLSMRNLNTMPWIVLNHKREELIDSVDGAQFVDLDFVPKKPGLYIYHPLPDDDEAVTALLYKIYLKGRCGIYVDEGTMLKPTNRAMNACLTQGRSKHIPIIILSQRPVGLTRHARTEADHYQIFELIDKADRDVLRGFVAADLEAWMDADEGKEPKLPKYHSLWYDVGQRRVFLMKPVPGDDVILGMFDAQLAPPSKKKIFL